MSLPHREQSGPVGISHNGTITSALPLSPGSLPAYQPEAGAAPAVPTSSMVASTDDRSSSSSTSATPTSSAQRVFEEPKISDAAPPTGPRVSLEPRWSWRDVYLQCVDDWFMEDIEPILLELKKSVLLSKLPAGEDSEEARQEQSAGLRKPFVSAVDPPPSELDEVDDDEIGTQ